jgi:hypothetical protein
MRQTGNATFRREFLKVPVPSGSCEEIALGTNTITVTNMVMAIHCG